jgi:hypothetical protein
MMSVKRLIINLIASLIIILLFIVLDVAATPSPMLGPVITAPFKVSIIRYPLR